ncbi:MAG TPA: fatty acid desaturase [Gemmatimonadaceae bacterium]|nr:fatty acid desaturase [Gemmatimonadaceae bacterium]
MTHQLATTDAPDALAAIRAPAARFDPYHPFRRTLLSPEQVRTLSALRPGRVVADTLWCWLWIIGAWAAVATWTQWWVVALAIPVIGTRYYALFIIGHDGLHRRLFPNRERNDLFNDICILGALGAITRINNRNHLRHHQQLATHEDPDRHRHACFNKSEIVEVVAYLSGISSVFTAVTNVFFPKAVTKKIDTIDGVEVQGEPGTPLASKPETYTARDMVILLAWQVVLIGGLSWTIGWWAYPMLWLFPVFVFTYLGDNLRSFVEHSHPEADDKADTHRLVTHTSNRLERLFVAPMNMNYHAAHHLWVGIPYYNLPQADRLMREHPGSTALEWRRSYIAYLWRYMRATPLDECKGGQ